MGISIRAYARTRGCSEGAVRKAIRDKRITPEADGTIDPQRANREWTQNTFANRTLRQEELQPPELPSSSDPGVAYRNAKLAEKIYSAKLLRLRYEERAGVLIQATKAGEYATNWSSIVSDALSAFPDRVAPLVAAAKNEREIHKILATETNALLRKAAKAVADCGF